LAGGTTVNLFCSGHAFLPDGRLLVGGGHLADGDGVNQAALYQTEAGASRAGVWSATGLMNKGRWYPTATTLPDGRALMLGGQYKINGTGDSLPNMTPQVWDNGAWIALVDAPHELVLDNYPRVHVASDGRVLVSGPLQQSWWLDTAGGGRWEKATFAREAQRDYAPAVMYDVDKVIYLGGGGDPSKSNRVEIIDLGAASPTWERPQPGGDMNFPRRQHNATLLPDGTVLVTGGTRGGGFNDLAAGQPVHLAELWNPADSTWAILAAEEMDRCYHATAVLLPDATVLSAGGGEFKDGDQPNDPLDTHRNAQIFRPPYLFNGNRPEITDAPPAVGYGENFDVPTPQSADIGKVTWLRLPSVTHAFDQSQRINFLEFQAQAGSLRVTAPRSPNVCPPGHYMLFILTKGGVPSIAKTVEIRLAPSPTLQPIEALTARSFPPSSHREDQVHQDPHARRAGIVAAAEGAAVVVGITSICPYGLGACWGGAHEALTQLDGVQLVSPIASADDSTAEVFLGDDRLPALVLWTEQFNRIVDGRYVLRGVEMTLHGAVSALDGGIVLAGAGRRPSVHLVPVRDGEKIQWDHNARTIKPLEPDEADAYERLNHALDDAPDGQTVTVTGPLTMTDRRFQLHVRRFSGD
jgi:hypothetical protein